MLPHGRKRRFFEKMDEIYRPPKRLSAGGDEPVDALTHELKKMANAAENDQEMAKKDSKMPTEVDEVPKEVEVNTMPMNAKKEKKEDTMPKNMYIVPLGNDVSRKRIEIWKNRLKGGDLHVQDKYNADTDLVVASTTISREKIAEMCPRVDFQRVVTPEWLVHFIKTKENSSGYVWYSEAEQAKVMEDAAAKNEAAPESPKSEPLQKNESSSVEQCTDPPPTVAAPGVSQEDEDPLEARREIFYKNNPGMRSVHAAENAQTRKIKTDGFVCMTTSVLKKNLNEHLTGPLEELIEYLHVEKDEWRENSYKRIVSILKQMPERVTCASMLKPQHGFNSNGIAKMREILETGTLRKLEAKKADARLQVLRTFSNIWGVGPATATELYSAGFRTLDELRRKQDDVLTHNQKIGLKHYDDFLVKIPRQEVEEIERVVKEHIHELLPRAIAITCGSYRRGKMQSGDVDILFTDPSADECCILPQLLKRLHAIGFLTDDLTTVLEHHIGSHDSYMGVCRLKEGMRYRRIDIKVYPRNFFGYALLYFTGSDHFNRSMRAYAKMKGYSLTDKGLFKAARSKGVQKLKKGPNLICPDERDVFIALQLPYKRPSERNCMA